MRTALILAATVLLFSAPAAAQELYQWVDEEGQAHWTDDLTRVPPRYREEAVERDLPGAAIQTYQPPAKLVPDGPETGVDQPRQHRIRFERAGLEILVPVTLNGRVRAPFKVDTGAMMNTIPRSVVEQLGIPIDDKGRKIVISGIGGQPMLVPVVRLRTATLGEATVENVDVAVLDTMTVGLLGMPFFRHFRVDLDPAQGLMTLEEVDLTQVEGIYGGYPESYWRTSFQMVRAQLEVIEQHRGSISRTFGEMHERLDEAEQYWDGEYDRLELEASRAGVPRAWRE
jgi:hypothetical protein